VGLFCGGGYGGDFSILASEFSLLLLEWLLGREGLRFWQMGLFCSDWEWGALAWFGARWSGPERARRHRTWVKARDVGARILGPQAGRVNGVIES